ncbi:MAG: Nif3-like dinuclear metal center hexameric protein [Firmicutes bacterium]|nr:Nif3-like dinuclear metal center hexameric protein [Bacillota bacterium]
MADKNLIFSALEELAPPELAEEWDNVGLQVGQKKGNVNKAFLSLDATLPVVEEAKKIGADLIVTHHPLLYKPLKNVDFSTPSGKIINLLIKSGIDLYSLHTNLDSAVSGTSRTLASMLGLKNLRPVIPSSVSPSCGMGVYGVFTSPLKFSKVISKVKKVLHEADIRYCGEHSKNIKTAAVCTGSGGSLLNKIFKMKVDLFITGELKYHEALEASQRGLAVITAGHYHTETIILPVLKKYLEKKFPSLKVFISAISTSPLNA